MLAASAGPACTRRSVSPLHAHANQGRTGHGSVSVFGLLHAWARGPSGVSTRPLRRTHAAGCPGSPSITRTCPRSSARPTRSRGLDTPGGCGGPPAIASVAPPCNCACRPNDQGYRRRGAVGPPRLGSHSPCPGKPGAPAFTDPRLHVHTPPWRGHVWSARRRMPAIPNC